GDGVQPGREGPGDGPGLARQDQEHGLEGVLGVGPGQPHARRPHPGPVPPDQRLERPVVVVAGVPLQQVPVGPGRRTQQSQHADHRPPTWPTGETWHGEKWEKCVGPGHKVNASGQRGGYFPTSSVTPATRTSLYPASGADLGGAALRTAAKTFAT